RTWGPRTGPQTPNARKRRGQAVALLGMAQAAPKWPPNPQRSEAPRPSRGAPRDGASGPEMAPKPPPLGSAAAKPWRSSGWRKRPRNGPQPPTARTRRGQAVALLGMAQPAPKLPPNPDHERAAPKPWRAPG